MKWFYRILRLFFCPHKWIETGESISKIAVYPSINKECITGMRRICKCTICGTIRAFKL